MLIRCLLLLCSLWMMAIPAQTLRLVADEEKRGGYLLDISRQALQAQGYRVTVRYLPWRRALESCMTGQACDMLVGVYRNEERQRHLLYTEAIGKMELSLFSLESRQIKVDSLQDLAGLRIGVIRGAMVSQAFDQADFLQTEAVDSIQQNIRKLLAGRIDLFADKKLTTLYILRSQFPLLADTVKVLEPPLRRDDFYNAVPRQLPHAGQLVLDFNQGLRLIRQNGSYDSLVNHAAHE